MHKASHKMREVKRRKEERSNESEKKSNKAVVKRYRPAVKGDGDEEGGLRAADRSIGTDTH